VTKGIILAILMTGIKLFKLNSKQIFLTYIAVNE